MMLSSLEMHDHRDVLHLLPMAVIENTCENQARKTAEYCRQKEHAQYRIRYAAVNIMTGQWDHQIPKCDKIANIECSGEGPEQGH